MSITLRASLLLLHGSATAFELGVVTQFGAARGMCPRAAAPFMVAAKDVFGQYYEASPPVQKSMRTLPAPIAKVAMGGLVAVSGMAGFALTPSRRIPVNAIGGVITAIGGNVARKRLLAVRQKAAIPAVAALLSEGLAKVTPEGLAAIAVEYDVPKKEFQSQLAELYLTYISACLNAHAVETSELSDLLRLQKLLRLSSAQVGGQIFAAARQLFSRHRAYLEDTEPNDSKRLLTKFVFLAERILAEDESPEGYKYEVLRLQKLFSLTVKEWRAMAEDAAVPFYEKALNSAVMEAKPVTAEQLAAVRASLGIAASCADRMHADIFKRSVSTALSSGRLSDADKDRLAAIQTLLEMSDSASSESLRALTAPLYATTFEKVLGKLGELEGEVNERMSAQLAGELTLRQQELLLQLADTRPVEAVVLKKVAKARLDESLQFLRASNLPASLKSVQSLVSFCARLANFLVSINRAEGDVDAAIATLFGGIKGEVKQSEVLGLYRALLLHFLEDLKVDAADAATLDRLRVILGLQAAESASIYQAAAGPLFRAALQKAVEGSKYGVEQKAAIEASLTDLALPASVTLSISMDVYSAKLRSIAGAGKLMEEESTAGLSSLRNFLGLEMANVQALHEEVCGPSYRDSVRQVMSTAGAIPEEYFEGLNTLRERLGISEASAKQSFALEVTAKMKEFGTKAVNALAEKMNDPKEASKDGKGSMNMAAGASFTTELLNLVDFAVASKAIVVEDGKTLGVGANLRGELSELALRELYKNYLAEAFSGAEASTKSKIFESLDKLSLVLGLTDGEINAIHNEIGSMIYRQYISKALVKGPLGKEEVSFLRSVKDTLGMDQSLCDELVREQQMNRVSNLIESMFEKDQVRVEDVRTMRDTAALFDVDLLTDLQVSRIKLERFFNVELEALLEDGEIKSDDMSSLEELCESLQIGEERATQLLSELVQRKISGGVLQAAAMMRGGATKEVMEQLKSVLKCAAVLDVQAKCSVSASERSELYMLFQAGQLSGGGDNVERQAQLELLKSTLGLTGAGVLA